MERIFQIYSDSKRVSFLNKVTFTTLIRIFEVKKKRKIR